MKLTVTKSRGEYHGTMEVKDGDTIDVKLELAGKVIKGYLVHERDAFLMFEFKRDGDAYLLTSAGIKNRLTREKED